MVVDLHVHAAPSAQPGRGVDPAAALARAAALGLDGVALVGDGALPDVAALRTPGAPAAVFAGAEVDTDRGHYLVFFPAPAEIPSLEAVFGPREAGPWAVRDVVARTNALGGAVVAAHPYERDLPRPGGDIVYTLRGLAALEAVNSRRPRGSRPAIEAAEVLGLPCTGGSDARTAEEVGRAATLFPERFADEAGLVAALQSGRCRPVEFGPPPPQLASHASGPRPAPHAHEGPPREGGRPDDGRRRGRRRR